MSERPDDPLDTPSPADAPEPWRGEAPADDPTAASSDSHESPTPTLWPVVVQAIAEREWTMDTTGETSALLRVRGRATNYDFALSTFEELAVVRGSIGLHLYTAEPFRAAMGDLLNRINHDELLLGSFELEPELGRVRWRQAIDVEGGVLSTTMVHNLINAGFWACDRFWPALVAVGTLGTSPEAALEIAQEE